MLQRVKQPHRDFLDECFFFLKLDVLCGKEEKRMEMGYDFINSVNVDTIFPLPVSMKCKLCSVHSY